MGRLGVSKIDKPLKDEDKWLGMTKKQLLYMVVAVALSVYTVRICHAVHLTVIGVVFAILLIVLAIVLCFVKIPYKNYLNGGGLTAEQLFLRLLHRRKKRNRKVYSAVATNNKKQKKGVRLPFLGSL